MICQKCLKEFPVRIYIDGKQRNLSKRKFCLECSPFRQHNTSQLKYGEDEHICSKCKKTLPRSEFYLRSGRKNKCSSYCKKCTQQVNNKRINDNKKKAVEYKGGECQKCGYKKYLGALDFHHIDPSKKDFEIRTLRAYSWQNLKKELDKCILLCANCHRELHGNIWHP